MNVFRTGEAERYRNEVSNLPHVRSPYYAEDFTFKDSKGPGLQAPTELCHLMKVLFAGRLCCPDILVGITMLASEVTCWQHADSEL